MSINGDRQTVSAYIITKNEELNIRRAIESVRWMDEVIVLDSGSTDGTVQIARNMGAKVTISEFGGYADQKNDAMKLCASAWTFNLDADEEVTSELRQSIETILAKEKPSDDSGVYCMSRKTEYLGRWIEHCGWYPEYRTRLSRLGQANWVGGSIHEELKGGGNAVRLSGDLLHRPYADLGEHLSTIKKYAELWALREVKAGRKVGYFDIIIRSAARFLKMYVLRAGFLDNGPGFIASAMGSWYVFMKYSRLYEMTRKGK